MKWSLAELERRVKEHLPECPYEGGVCVVDELWEVVLELSKERVELAKAVKYYDTWLVREQARLTGLYVGSEEEYYGNK